MSDFSINYKASPTCARFHRSKALVRGIKGPIGSGKSVANIIEIYRLARLQEPDIENIRRTRFVVVRNTLPQLETTTIKTWDEWFPENKGFGRRTKKPPYNQIIRQELDDGTKLEAEIIFLALDKPEDEDKLLSLEVTYIFWNEAKLFRKSLIDAGLGRCGRYPSKKMKPDNVPSDQWPTRYGMIMDTNPPDDEHWWYKCAVENAWRFDPKLGKMRELDEIAEQDRWEFFDQPSGITPEAENIQNLPRNYYENLCIGRDKEWIKVYVEGQYGYVKAGLPVYESSWNDGWHVAKEPLKVNPHLPVIIGFDCSGRWPSAVFLQRTSIGQWYCFHELCGEKMGAERFCDILKSEIAQICPQNDIRIYGDPAGTWKTQNDERTYVEIARAAGLKVLPAPTTNRLPERIATVEHVLNKNIAGQPAFLLSPTCTRLRRGFNGGYKYRQLQVSGEARYNDEPEKNKFSHPHDGLQYGLCGGGETKSLKQQNDRSQGTIMANTGFNI